MLRQREPLPAGIRRIGVGFLDAAIAALAHTDRDRAVAEGRHAIRRSRALIRLVRHGVGEGVFRHEDRQLREADALVAPTTDAATLVRSLDLLVERFVDRLAPGAFDGTRHQLQALASATGDQEVAAAIEKLTAARQRYWASTIPGDGFETIAAGLEYTYRLGRHHLDEAYRLDDDASFDALGEQVSHLHVQSVLLDDVWGDQWFTAELQQLSAALAQCRSLLELEHAVEVYQLGEDTEDRELLALLAAGRRQDIHAAVRPLGERIYAEEHDSFMGRLAARFERWHED